MCPLRSAMMCFLMASFPRRDRGTTLDYPKGTECMVFAYMPDIADNDNMKSMIHVVTSSDVNETDIYVRVLSSKRHIQPWNVNKTAYSANFIIIEGLNIPVADDERIVYHLRSPSTPFTATFILVNRKTNIIHQAYILRPDYTVARNYFVSLQRILPVYVTSLKMAKSKGYGDVDTNTRTQEYGVQKRGKPRVFLMAMPVSNDMQYELVIRPQTYTCDFVLECNNGMTPCKKKWMRKRKFAAFSRQFKVKESLQVFFVTVRVSGKTHDLMTSLRLTHNKLIQRLQIPIIGTDFYTKDSIIYKFSLLKIGHAIGFILTCKITTISKIRYDQVLLSSLITWKEKLNYCTAVKFNVSSSSAPVHTLESHKSVDTYYFYVVVWKSGSLPYLLSFLALPFKHEFEPCVKNRTIPGDGFDNDCDGFVDEEKADGRDNDYDLLIDEDLEVHVPVDGQWSEWGLWTCHVHDCLAIGAFERSRYCGNPLPQYGGHPCSGDSTNRLGQCRGRGTCFRECPAGTYGWGCKKNCSDSCFNDTCTKLHGDCIGCKPGYLVSTRCNVECEIHKWGENCEGICPEICFDTCKPTDGECLNTTYSELHIPPEIKVYVAALPVLLLFMSLCCACVCFPTANMAKRKRRRRRVKKRIRRRRKRGTRLFSDVDLNEESFYEEEEEEEDREYHPLRVTILTDRSSEYDQYRQSHWGSLESWESEM